MFPLLVSISLWPLNRCGVEVHHRAAGFEEPFLKVMVTVGVKEDDIMSPESPAL